MFFFSGYLDGLRRRNMWSEFKRAVEERAGNDPSIWIHQDELTVLQSQTTGLSIRCLVSHFCMAPHAVTTEVIQNMERSFRAGETQAVISYGRQLRDWQTDSNKLQHS